MGREDSGYRRKINSWNVNIVVNSRQEEETLGSFSPGIISTWPILRLIWSCAIGQPGLMSRRFETRGVVGNALADPNLGKGSVVTTPPTFLPVQRQSNPSPITSWDLRGQRDELIVSLSNEVIGKPTAIANVDREIAHGQRNVPPQSPLLFFMTSFGELLRDAIAQSFVYESISKIESVSKKSSVDIHSSNLNTQRNLTRSSSSLIDQSFFPPTILEGRSISGPTVVSF